MGAALWYFFLPQKARCLQLIHTKSERITNSIGKTWLMKKKYRNVNFEILKSVWLTEQFKNCVPNLKKKKKKDNQEGNKV